MRLKVKAWSEIKGQEINSQLFAIHQDVVAIFNVRLDDLLLKLRPVLGLLRSSCFDRGILVDSGRRTVCLWRGFRQLCTRSDSKLANFRLPIRQKRHEVCRVCLDSVERFWKCVVRRGPCARVETRCCVGSVFGWFRCR